MKWGDKLQPGETVLVNGAMRVVEKLAIQIAILLGAGRVVGTGRNLEPLRRVSALGAVAVIDLKLPEELLAEAIKNNAGAGYAVIFDFLWEARPKS